MSFDEFLFLIMTSLLVVAFFIGAFLG